MDRPGLYVHVPFCARKCPYCDFFSVSALELTPVYLKALAQEAARAAAFWRTPFDTLYIGGGSPSLLSRGDLKALKAALSPLELTPDAETTLEVNPEDADPDKMAFWADWGVTRLSLGAQTFDARFLAGSLGRTHLPADSFAAMEAAAAAGLSLSLDLIYGHAGQNPEDWAADLDKASASWAEHISAYALTPAPGTPLARALAERLVPRLLGEAASAELFALTAEALKIRGFERYEVSNFARGGAVCRHNLKYWRRTPYLGLGPSAHSFDGTRRWADEASVRRWAAALDRQDEPRSFVEEVTPEQARLEAIMLGLRLSEGFSASLLKPSQALEDFCAQGYLELEDELIKPTEKGLAVADFLARQLA
ncbi:MAG: radical SAM family heme chaperone HemW [Deltaproteobacteria bacterium]|jgi:oxygen-independent coproporphyrinogen-3 oxidase|nr:radical SAM family heme chaperone HemW [Deltaproteobacteria bacterium]